MLDQVRQLKIARILCLTSCICTIALATILFSSQPDAPHTSQLLILAGLVAFSIFLVKYGTSKAVGIMVAIVGVNLFLLIPEFCLRISGFQYVSGIQWSLREKYFTGFETDSNLFWTLPRSSHGVNSFGMEGPEPAIPKPPNTIRLLFLGDSCTFQGYPDLVQRYLRNFISSSKIESVVLALPGYSSHQGKILAKLYGEKLQPDLVFVYFGWNDHWLAYGAPDSKKTSSPAIENFYRRIRLLQGLSKISVKLGLISDQPLNQPRVSLEEYEKNLSEILSLFKRRSIPVIFLTAPTSHYQLGVPRYLIYLKYARDEYSVSSWHQAYNEVVRQVSASQGGALVDLERQYRQIDDPRKIFLEDGIHFTKPYGLNAMAKVLADFVRKNFLK